MGNGGTCLMKFVSTHRHLVFKPGTEITLPRMSVCVCVFVSVCVCVHPKGINNRWHDMV